MNVLSRRLATPRERAFSDGAGGPERRAFCTLLAVPAGPVEDAGDLSVLAQFLIPDPASGRVRRPWLPAEDARYSSDGVYVHEADYRNSGNERRWRKYALMRRDGWIEFTRHAGFTFKGRVFYEYAPLVALCQKFTELVQDARREFFVGIPYWFVAILHDTRDGVLCAFGDHWREPSDWDSDALERWSCLDDRVVFGCEVDGDEGPGDVAAWFADRLGNAFGLPEPRCYNHPESDGRRGPAGALPNDRTDFS